MFAPPPNLITTAINSINSKRLLNFYRELGILFNTEYKENGRKFYSYIISYTYYDFDLRFEIYDVEYAEEASKNVNLTFFIDEIDGYLEGLIKNDGRVIKDSWKTESHQYVLLNDPDGHFIQLITKL